MKKLLLLFLLSPLLALAQISPQITGAGAPSNPCFNGGQQYLDTTNHVLYGCPSNGANWVNLSLGNLTNPTIRSLSSDPATCSTTSLVGESNLYYNTSTAQYKYCSATNTWTNVSGGGGGVTSFSGDGTVITNSASTGAVTATIAGTSGGVPYFNSASTWTSSGALTSNVLVKGGGAGAAPANSLATDNGTTLSYTGTGGVNASAGPLNSGANGGTGGSLTLKGATSGTATISPNATASVVTSGQPQFNIGTAAGGNGVLGLIGNTSGTATLTAPATAGTSTNPIVFSNVIQVPVGAAGTTAVQFGAANTGLFSSGNNLIYQSSGTAAIGTAATSFSDNTAGAIGFSTAPGTTGNRTGISEAGAAAVLAIGNGGAGDETGLLRWNECRVTGDITLTVNTNITVCTWSLPAVAKSWGWQCRIPWVISAGTGTNTISIGVNASQTPTATTTASATILTTNTGTQTNATVNLSASGAVNVLTSGTITPAATVFQSETFGTLAASATAGTFTITMDAAGTTATALAKAGATCILY